MKMGSKRMWVAGLLLAMAGARGEDLMQRAQRVAAAKSNPLVGNPRALRAGAKLFARECASCHGANGAGGLGKAPPLRQKEVYQAAPGVLFWILRNGALHHGMPSFAHLPEAQRWQIITWLKSQHPT